MTYAEQRDAEKKVAQLLHKDYLKRSERVQDQDLKNIYWNIANACDRDDAGRAGATEALYERQMLVWDGVS